MSLQFSYESYDGEGTFDIYVEGADNLSANVKAELVQELEKSVDLLDNLFTGMLSDPEAIQIDLESLLSYENLYGVGYAVGSKEYESVKALNSIVNK